MNSAILFSGGKDSCYALFKAENVKCLISFEPAKDSYLFHYPNIELVKEQAKLLNIPLIYTKTNNKNEFNDLKKILKQAIRKYKIKALYSGTVKSNYQKAKIEDVCKKLKIKTYFPLWHIDEEEYLNKLIKHKFKVIITGIAALGLDKSFLGKIIDGDIIKRLKKVNKKYKIHMSLEGGEGETFVINCPLFNKKINIDKAEIKMENECTGQYIIKRISLINK